MDFIELAAFGVVGFLSGALTVATLFYYLKSSHFIEETAFNILNGIVSDEELQKTLYQIGGLIGTGVKGGFGIESPIKNRGGRFKWQDYALELATQFIQKSISNPSPSSLQPTPSPNITQRDKFFNT